MKRLQYDFFVCYSDKPPMGSSIDTEKASEAGVSLHSSIEKSDGAEDGVPQGM